MFFSTLITSLFSILASTPIGSIFDGLLVVIDRGVYRLVQSSFTLFMIMCQLNLNVIYDMAVSLVDRLKALIIVFVIFKVGVALIQYMLDPDKAAKGSKKFLLNILICAAMLVSYNFVFSVFNELSMMILGKPENYKYTTLAQIANVSNDADEGLIFRLFFGKNNNATALKNVESIGNNIAFNALCATFPDNDATGLQCRGLIQTIGDGSTESNYNIKKLNNITKKLDVSVDGHPGIALILGLYMVYSVIKAAIEIGVRMFKLMLLQLVAPIAIISVASDDGVKSKPFSQFIKMYISVFVSAFTRITAVLLVTVFVSKVFTQIDTIIGNVTANGYSLWIIIICIVAGYKFAGDIPKMIDKIFETHLGEDPDKGFGKFLTTLAAAPVLGAWGLASGTAAGIGAGTWGSALVGGVTGLTSGLAAGFKGNSIADKMKAATESRKNTRARTMDVADAGGVFPWMYGGMLSPFKGAQDSHLASMEKEIAPYDDTTKLIDEYGKMRAAAIKDEKVATGEYDASIFSAAITNESYGDSKDAFVEKTKKYSTDYQRKKEAYDTAVKNGTGDVSALYNDMIAAEQTATDAAKAMWESKRNAMPEGAEAEAVRLEIDANLQKLGVSGTKDGVTYTSMSSTDVKNSSDALTKALATGSDEIRSKRRKYMASKSYKATHRKKDSGK